MFEFVLSKLNMLLFATAIAAIVLFFMTSFNSNIQTRRSFELLYNYGNQLKSGIDSPSYCTIKYINLPAYIKTNDGSSIQYNANYLFNVNSYETNPETTNYNHKLVLTATDKRKKNIFAAYDVDFNGTMHFYTSKYPYDVKDNWKENDKNASYDPQQVRSNNHLFVFMKKINTNNINYYLVPCDKINGKYSCKDFVCNQSDDFKDVDCKNTQLCHTEENSN